MRYWPRGLGLAKCPFYITDSRHTISCEAASGTGAERMRLIFDEEKEKNRYIMEKCIEPVPECMYYKMLYEDEEEK